MRRLRWVSCEVMNIFLQQNNRGMSDVKFSIGQVKIRKANTKNNPVNKVHSRSQDHRQWVLMIYNWWIKERQGVINRQYSDNNLWLGQMMATKMRWKYIFPRFNISGLLMKIKVKRSITLPHI